jgi:hypothetical protein
MSQTITLGLGYCCCNAAGSLCNACFGSTEAGTTGRKRSVLLLTAAIALAFWFQYWVGPSIVSQSGWAWEFYRWIPGLGKMVYRGWHDPCSKYDTEETQAVLKQCAGLAGVYRPMAVTTLFFAAFAVAAKVQPSFNKKVWPAKYGVFLAAVLVTVFMASAPLFTGLYLWLARAGATIFVLLQQVILIDVAYNWNEDWIDRADQADRLVYGSGSAWLQAVVGTCVAFYVASITGIVLLYRHFDGCAENTWIITLTLLGILAMTGIQLSGTEGSLLTSSIVSLYVTYLAYSMVSKNPNAECNPVMGNNDVAGMIIGLTLTAVSLAWTGFSWTAEDRLTTEAVQSAKSVTGVPPTAGGAGQQVNLDVPFLDPEDAPTSGLVMDSDTLQATEQGAHLWKLNVVMALISCWVAMLLTGWGTLETVDDETTKLANPTVGRFNMAMIGVSQWCAILLYIWTLLAPIVFPDRDFS